jgi:hypothetical protein
MKTLIIISILFSLTATSQQNCNLDKIENLVYKTDSTSKIYYYNNDQTNYIAYYKHNANKIIKTLFDLNFISPKTLLKVTGYVGKPLTKIDSVAHTVLYYSDPADKYVSFPTNTFVLINAKELSRQKNKFVITIKAESGQFNFNYDLEYTTKELITKKSDINQLLKNAKLTCVKFAGNDF